MCEEQSLNDYITEQCALIDAALDRLLPAEDESPETIHKAMRYSMFAGGKRMRPVLCMAAAEACGGLAVNALVPACAVEMMHTYSLIHDDLPAMDNDDLRRGKPTTHRAFDEATAILAGDALQTRAFEVIAAADAPAQLRVDWLRTLADASGAGGMCGGQALDIDATGRLQSLDELQRMHALKTGGLIRAAVRLGALGGGAAESDLARLDDFASALGLAFQVRDDILDIEASSEQLGKTAGKDVAQAKATFPALLGVDGSRVRLQALSALMQEALSTIPADTASLADLARMVVDRTH